MPRRMHPTFSFETSNAPDWYGDVRLCRTGLNPHFLFVLPKRLPGFPAELYRFGTEKPGGYSLLKRECPPRPPKEKRGGISISPRTPLKRLKGAKLRFLPFGNPSKDKGSGSGERSRGCPLCDPTNAMPANAGTHSGHLGTFSAAGRRLLIFVGSSYRPLLRMGELAASPVNSSLSVFSFDHEWPFSFRQDEKKMGIQSSAA